MNWPGFPRGVTVRYRTHWIIIFYYSAEGMNTIPYSSFYRNFLRCHNRTQVSTYRAFQIVWPRHEAQCLCCERRQYPTVHDPMAVETVTDGIIYFLLHEFNVVSIVVSIVSLDVTDITGGLCVLLNRQLCLSCLWKQPPQLINIGMSNEYLR